MFLSSSVIAIEIAMTVWFATNEDPMNLSLVVRVGLPIAATPTTV